jgi:hypothetical protein
LRARVGNVRHHHQVGRGANLLVLSIEGVVWKQIDGPTAQLLRDGNQRDERALCCNDVDVELAGVRKDFVWTKRVAALGRRVPRENQRRLFRLIVRRRRGNLLVEPWRYPIGGASACIAHDHRKWRNHES